MEDVDEEEEPTRIDLSAKKGKEVQNNQLPTRKPKVLFPQRFRNDIDNAKYGKFLQMLHQLHIDMPFVDALEEMPYYAKFLKEQLCIRKCLRNSKIRGSGALQFLATLNLNLSTLKPTRICIQLADRSTKYHRGFCRGRLGKGRQIHISS
ncbi:PREDICTED: uncharacterized protein LOC109169397 [Ipomoea nil]|uniref:uncharacterized protein LOC109169397 n=1 Tax=Ipomoea nil TaxID=35883 RepID=UPI000901F521|nr:PREDICTED: uncharacterized protein LOC109169397 [Ipomoea nil]